MKILGSEAGRNRNNFGLQAVSFGDTQTCNIINIIVKIAYKGKITTKYGD